MERGHCTGCWWIIGNGKKKRCRYFRRDTHYPRISNIEGCQHFDNLDLLRGRFLAGLERQQYRRLQDVV